MIGSDGAGTDSTDQEDAVRGEEECAECGETREHHDPIPFVPKQPDDYTNSEEWEL